MDFIAILDFFFILYSDFRLWLLVLVALIIFLILKRHELGFLKSRYYIALGLLSLVFWLLAVRHYLNLDLDCLPDDQFCNWGNTFWGGVWWGSIVTVPGIIYAWAIAVVIGFYLWRKKHR